ncbi:MAG: flagellar motor protein [Calditrichaeota bacterium]|nr:MAG: flagellar motor protein [Calditrichota bacterium]
MDWDSIPNQEEESGEEAGWIVTFSDLMSLLLCFFILLFSFSTIQEQKFKELLASLQSAFGVDQVPEAGTREGLDMLNRNPSKTNPNAVDELGGMVQKEMEKIKSEVEEFVMKNKLGGKVKVEIGDRGAVITISDVVIFPPGEAEFTGEATPILEKITDLLRQFPYKVKVEGHTDNVPIHTDKYPSNWELSTARAAKLVRYFIEHGIDPTRLSAEGYAEYHPIADNATPEGRARNRRVEIVYTRESILEGMKQRAASEQVTGTSR